MDERINVYIALEMSEKTQSATIPLIMLRPPEFDERMIALARTARGKATWNALSRSSSSASSLEHLGTILPRGRIVTCDEDRYYCGVARLCCHFCCHLFQLPTKAPASRF